MGLSRFQIHNYDVVKDAMDQLLVLAYAPVNISPPPNNNNKEARSCSVLQEILQKYPDLNPMEMTLTVTAFNTAIGKHPDLKTACNRFDKGNTTGVFRYKLRQQYFYYIGRPDIQPPKRPTPGPTWGEDIIKVETSWQRTAMEEEESEQHKAKRQRLHNNLESGRRGTDDNGANSKENAPVDLGAVEVSNANGADSNVLGAATDK